jgi:hypothetical protein
MYRSQLTTYHDLNFTHIVFEWVEGEEDGHGGFDAFLYSDRNLHGYGRSQLEAAVNLVLAYKAAEEKGLEKQ